MVRRILSIVVKDVATGSRDQLTTYILLGPLLLGLLTAAVMPLVEGGGLAFAAVEGLHPGLREALELEGELELVPDRQALEQRVLRRDDVAGVLTTAEGPALVLHGDEPAALRERAGLVLDRAMAGRPPAALTRSAPLRPIVGALLGFSVVVLMGLAAGFTILEEKTTGVSQALAVTPLRFAEHATAKIGLSVLLGLVLVPAALVIPMGWSIRLGALLQATLASAPFALSLGLLVGVYANDQLGAVAIMKALLPVWTSLPVASFVVGEPWVRALWPMSNHWGVLAFHAALTGEPAGPDALRALLTGLPVLAVTLWWLRRRLGLR